MFSRIYRIFRVDASEETNSMATELAMLFSYTQIKTGESLQVNDFHKGEANPFTTDKLELKTADEELGALFFLGHSDHEVFGEFTAKEFVEFFAKAFQAKKSWNLFTKPPFTHQDKLKVKAIYLFGCATGLSNAGQNDSYAQQVANYLFANGFTEACVYAAAYEKQEPDETMYVEVIWKPVFYDQKTRRGYISAYALDQQTATTIKTLQEQEQSPEVKRQIKHHYAVAKAKRVALAKNVPPLEYLQQEENRFVANETDEKRKQRIAKDPGYIDRTRRKIVIALIKVIIDEKDIAKNKKTLLNCFLQELQNNKEASWQEICMTYKKRYKKLISILHYTPPSTTLDLLEIISQGQLPSSRQRSSPKLKEEKRPLISKPKTRYSRMRQANTFFSVVKADPNDIPDELSEKISALDLLLSEEISLLTKRSERACITTFIRFEMNTKIKKRACLEALKEAKTLEALQSQAKKSLGERSVTWRFFNTATEEWRKSRVRDLLQEIVNHDSYQEEDKSEGKKEASLPALG